VLGVPALTTAAAVLLTKRTRVNAPPPADLELVRGVMRCLRPEQLPVLATLARSCTPCAPGAPLGARGDLAEPQLRVRRHVRRHSRHRDWFLPQPDHLRTTDRGRASWRIYRDGMAQVMAYERLLEEDDSPGPCW